MTRSVPHLSRELLYRLSTTEGLSNEKIAQVVGVSPKTVSRRLVSYGIKIPKPRWSKIILDDESLRQAYVTEGLSVGKTALRFGVSVTVVKREFKRIGIEIRKPDYKGPTIDRETLARLYISEGLSGEDLAKAFGIGRNKMYGLLKELGLSRRPGYFDSGRPHKPKGPRPQFIDPDILYQLHVTEKRSPFKIAEILGVGRSAVYRRLHKYGIKLPQSEYLPKRPSRPIKLPPGVTRDTIYQLHVIERRSPEAISKILGVGDGLIYRSLNEWGLKIPRSQYSTKRKFTPRAKVYLDAEPLKYMYHEQKLSAREIAENLGIPRASVVREICRHGLNKRLYKEKWAEEARKPFAFRVVKKKSSR